MMTIAEITEALKASEKPLVKIRDKGQHRIVGRLIGRTNRKAIVVPAGHKHAEGVDPKAISLWKKGERT